MRQIVFFTPNLNSLLFVLNGGDYVFIARVKNLTSFFVGIDKRTNCAIYVTASQ